MEVEDDPKMQPIGENAVNTPAFLGKLWKMVNDPSTDHLICWSSAGNSFVIQNQAQFWYELLPLYYKHNNMSSFVRQLNMYGFHKMSTVENGTMDADKDEIQFTHPYFQKDQPELLRNIKRKATNVKSTLESTTKHEDLTKVLSDVRQIRNRQVSVDNQLHSIKQENALLWREVAILRQKHIKQQKIVNKLIQFLVTLVQPSRMTVGVKRGYQLMLHGTPPKKGKISNPKTSSNVEGPTIHELDNELDIAPDLYDEEAPLVEGSSTELKNDTVDSPAASTTSQQNEVANSPVPPLFAEGNGDSVPPDPWDKPEFVDLNNMAPSDLIDNDFSDENLINTLQTEIDPNVDTEKVFLNPTTQDTMLSNLIKSTEDVENKNQNKNQVAQKSDGVKEKSLMPASKLNMEVAMRDSNLCDIIKSMPSTSDPYSTDLHTHIETTQNELEQFKDILNGYNSYVDANALLGLFSDQSPPPYDLSVNEEKNENLIDPSDPLVSGSELTTYGNNFDFTELFDDSIDGDNTTTVPTCEAVSSTVTTPQIMKEEPLFPSIQEDQK